jgi:hypothetical protein
MNKKNEPPERAVFNDLERGKGEATTENDLLGPSRCFSTASLGLTDLTSPSLLIIAIGEGNSSPGKPLTSAVS